MPSRWLKHASDKAVEDRNLFGSFAASTLPAITHPTSACWSSRVYASQARTAGCQVICCLGRSQRYVGRELLQAFVDLSAERTYQQAEADVARDYYAERLDGDEILGAVILFLRFGGSPPSPRVSKYLSVNHDGDRCRSRARNRCTGPTRRVRG
jgi:hypothetical protein